MKTNLKFFTCHKSPQSDALCLIGAIVLGGVLASSAQTNQYLFTGSKSNITLNAGSYVITAYGAQGGPSKPSSGGVGAEMQAQFSFQVRRHSPSWSGAAAAGATAPGAPVAAVAAASLSMAAHL